MEPSIQALVISLRGRPMDGTVIGLFLLATFLGGFTSGLTGFAAGLVVSGIWLHIITPLQTAVLIAAYGMVNQAYGIWKVRQALKWRRILPFVIGGAVGVPLGAYLVTFLNPAYLRIGVGALLVLYSIYNLARPTIAPIKSNPAIDTGIGVLNGLLGGLTGLGGVISTIWVQLGGGPTLQRRHPQAFLHGSAGAAAGLVGRHQTLRKTRRCGLSQGYSYFAADFRIVAGCAGILSLAACWRRRQQVEQLSWGQRRSPLQAQEPKHRLLRLRRGPMLSPAFSISPTELWHLIGTGNAPQVIDVRRRDIYESTPGLLPTSIWLEPTELPHWIATLDRARPIVVACKAGKELSQYITAELRGAGYNAAMLEGGSSVG